MELTLWLGKQRCKQVLTSLEVFKDALGELEQFLPFRGIRKGLTKLVTFDLRPQKMSPQAGRAQHAKTSH